MLRYRGSKKILTKVKELDAFPKVPEEYVDSTPVGGTLSILTFFFILWLIYSEVTYYLDSNLIFKFEPDTDMDAKLRINIDITVAMPCSNLGADILDSTSQSVYGFGQLQEEDTWFELTEEQQHAFDAMRYLNNHLREQYHSIWKILWKSGHGTMYATMPARKTKPNTKPDACRLHGVLTLNKVAGNFHVTAGKSLSLPRGHIHLNMLFDDTPQNFSHRINRLSFGAPYNGIVHPLEGDEKITSDENMLYQYFIEVVPTDIDTAFERIKAFQYSVKELERPISHSQGSHGIPGIFIKYDMAALKVRVYMERENIIKFMLRLFAVIGGIYIIVGFLNYIVILLRTAFIKKAAPNVYYNMQHSKIPVPPQVGPSLSLTNPLLTTTEYFVPVDIVKQ